MNRIIRVRIEFAIAVMGMIPAALIFLFFQRAFVRGIALTGLKE